MTVTYWLSLLHSLTKKNKILLFFFVFCSTFTIFANKLAKMLTHLCRLEPNLNANTKYGKEN